MGTSFANRSSVVLDKVASQSTAAIVASEAVGVPVLSVRSENRLEDCLPTFGTAMPVDTITVESAALLDNVLAGDSPSAFLARQHIPNAALAVRLSLVIVERTPQFTSAALAVEVIGMPALSEGGQVLSVNAFPTLVASVG